MVPADRINNILICTILFDKISANDGMAPGLSMVHGLSDIVKKAGSFSLFNIKIQLR